MTMFNKFYKYERNKDNKLKDLADWIFDLTEKQLNEAPFKEMTLSLLMKQRATLCLYSFNLGNISWQIAQRIGPDGIEDAYQLNYYFSTLLLLNKPEIINSVEQLVVDKKTLNHVDEIYKKKNNLVNNQERCFSLTGGFLITRMTEYHNLLNKEALQIIKEEKDNTSQQLPFDKLSELFAKDFFEKAQQIELSFLMDFSTYISLNTFNVLKKIIAQWF